MTRLMGVSKKVTGLKYCPAYLKVVKNNSNGSYRADAYFEHYGHGLSHALRPLSDIELAQIIKMMKCGATNMKIIEDCDKLGDDYRLSHLVPADLSYIRKVNFIPEGRFHEEDLQSVKLRVEKGEKEDGIHHFEEPDKNGSGFRLQGFLLSSSCTTEDVTKFFEVVKQQIPEFNPQFLMSDMADAFWKGFKKNHYLNRKTNIRVDELIQTLLNGFESVVKKIAKQAGRQLKSASIRRSENLKNCKKAMEQESNYFLSKNSDAYEVEKRGTDEFYTVTDSRSCQCYIDDNIHCNCGACSYRFRCTCLNQLAGISCKHVHMVLRSIGCTEQEDHEDDFEPFVDLPQPASFRAHNVQTSNTLQSSDTSVLLFDTFERGVNELVQKMLVLKKDGTQNSAMKKVLALVDEANKLLPANSKNIQIRRDASKPLTTARETEAMQSKKDPAICNVCSKGDPDFPSDMDLLEQDASTTEWLHCSNEECQIPVHFICSGSRKCRLCGSRLVNNSPTDDVVSDQSSDDIDLIEL
uniref:SWIM-type domain-containing protein n=2 Tax=Caenorhabditis japonica TaxID=281687 RepID=A0A8R1DTU7_CAEJA